MNNCFYNLDGMRNKEMIDLAPKIKVLLHKYFYGSPYTLLIIIDYLRDKCELADINYNHSARTFTIKFNKNTIKKMQKKYGVDDLDVNSLYKMIECPFHDFFLEIYQDFVKVVSDAPEVQHDLDEDSKIIEAFNFYIQYPESIKYLVQIVSMLERDNHVVINV